MLVVRLTCALEAVPKHGLRGCAALLRSVTAFELASTGCRGFSTEPESSNRVREQQQPLDLSRHRSDLPNGALQFEGVTFRAIPRWWNNARRPDAATRLNDGSQPPWTPTSQLDKRKTYPKRARHMLNVLNKEYEARVAKPRLDSKKFDHIRPGYVITVDMVVPENDMRPGHFTGIVLGIKNNGPLTRFWLRNFIQGTGCIERSFLLNSPFIKGITVHRKQPVNRAKLTYLRGMKDSANRFGDAGSAKSRNVFDDEDEDAGDADEDGR